jgi:glycosyltransferase involved in cell wall biosynthesis
MVSVIVPVHRGGESFRRCLESIAAARSGEDELIVVADGESDGSWRYAEDFGAIIIQIPTPHGPARARNLGAESARGDILFFTDADVTIPPDALRQVARAFEREPGLAALMGSYDDAPDVPNFLSQYKNLFHHHTHQTAREDASTFWGACGAIRRRVFLEMEGFDTVYRHPSIEDIELGYRLKSAGHEIRLLKSLQVKHLKHWKVASLLKSDFLRRALPWTELILRDRRFINDLNLRFSSRASVPVAFGIFGAMIGSLLWPPLLVVSLGLMAALFLLNAPLFLFFGRKRGLWFALKAFAWHCFYYVYSGLAFAIGCIRHRLGRQRLNRIVR